MKIFNQWWFWLIVIVAIVAILYFAGVFGKEDKETTDEANAPDVTNEEPAQKRKEAALSLTVPRVVKICHRKLNQCGNEIIRYGRKYYFGKWKGDCCYYYLPPITP